jgi:hypothetical protein
VIVLETPDGFHPADPTTLALERALSHAYPGLTQGAVRVTGREPNGSSSTFSTEVVTVGDGNSSTTLFCKHGHGYVDPYGHIRRGVPYEAAMYRDVIDESIAVPRYVGSFSGPHGTTLILEHLREAVSVAKSTYRREGPLADAVVALGRWHGRHEGAEWPPGQLNRYDRRHLDLWAHKAERLRRGVLRGVIDSKTIQETVRRLSVMMPTLMHGELFPANVLIAGGKLWFVDWESAGIGAGEIDLAALTSGTWHSSVLSELEDMYASSRWPNGAPGSYRAVVAAARVYIVVTIAWHEARARPQLRDASLAEQARQLSDRLLRLR